jgi:hypothetical protein
VEQFVLGLLKVLDQAQGILHARAAHPAIDIDNENAVAEHLDKAAAVYSR